MDEHHQIIFEKLYQLGKVELRSSSRTNYKGGGAGLGLAIASGIVKSHNGKIWVESAGHDEVNFPGQGILRSPVIGDVITVPILGFCLLPHFSIIFNVFRKNFLSHPEAGIEYQCEPASRLISIS